MIMINKYAIILSSIVDGATVRIQFLANSEMTANQLKSFYLCKGGASVSDVSVIQLNLQ